MGQHRALGHTGGAAGVLQERHVVVVDLDLRQGVAAAQLERLLEADRALQMVVGHHLLDVLEHEVDDRALGAEQIAQAGGDDLFDLGIGDDLFDGVAEVVHHHQCGHASIDQLMLQLARGVQRVDVDHGQPGTQHAEGGHRVLQAVGHHQGDAVALLELQFAQQVSGELFDQGIGLTVGEGLAETGVGRSVAVLRDGGVEDRNYRMELVDVDFGGNAFRIALQPGTIQTHIPPPGIVMMGAARTVSARTALRSIPSRRENAKRRAA
ncbi:hypothetical protein D3C73_1100790 [compost metagenome]